MRQQLRDESYRRRNQQQQRQQEQQGSNGTTLSGTRVRLFSPVSSPVRAVPTSPTNTQSTEPQTEQQQQQQQHQRSSSLPRRVALFEGKPIPDSPASFYVRSARLSRQRSGINNNKDDAIDASMNISPPQPRRVLFSSQPDVVIDIEDEQQLEQQQQHHQQRQQEQEQGDLPQGQYGDELFPTVEELLAAHGEMPLPLENDGNVDNNNDNGNNESNNDFELHDSGTMEERNSRFLFGWRCMRNMCRRRRRRQQDLVRERTIRI